MIGDGSTQPWTRHHGLYSEDGLFALDYVLEEAEKRGEFEPQRRELLAAIATYDKKVAAQAAMPARTVTPGFMATPGHNLFSGPGKFPSRRVTPPPVVVEIGAVVDTRPVDESRPRPPAKDQANFFDDLI